MGWPVYVTDDDQLRCDASDCPDEGGMMGLPGRRVTLGQVVEAVRAHRGP